MQRSKQLLREKREDANLVQCKTDSLMGPPSFKDALPAEEPLHSLTSLMKRLKQWTEVAASAVIGKLPASLWPRQAEGTRGHLCITVQGCLWPAAVLSPCTFDSLTSWRLNLRRFGTGLWATRSIPPSPYAVPVVARYQRPARGHVWTVELTS